jgi:putative protease
MIFDEEHLDDLGMGRLRLDFTVESLEETKQILSQFSSIYLNHSPEEISFDYTRGHFKRGVN